MFKRLKILGGHNPELTGDSDIHAAADAPAVFILVTCQGFSLFAPEMKSSKPSVKAGSSCVLCQP